VREVRKVVVGQDQVVDIMLAATSVGGHLLLEGVPGVAKTLVATAFARAVGVEFRRVQFTPDMLPSDLTGTMTLRSNERGERGSRSDPDRCSPTCSSPTRSTARRPGRRPLLEAMQENQVSVDGQPRAPRPLHRAATQNPIEYEGTTRFPKRSSTLPRQARCRLPDAPRTRPRCCASPPARRARDPRRRATGGHGRRPAPFALVERHDRERRGDRLRRRTGAADASSRASGSARVPRAVHLLAAAKAAARLANREFVVRMTSSRRTRRVAAPLATEARGRARAPHTTDDAVRTAISMVPIPR
jgi:MoxR-like ATPase